VQRRLRGWDDSATWDLDNEIARFALPRFKRYRELNDGLIANLTLEETNRVLCEVEWFLTVHADRGAYGELRGTDLERYREAKRLWGEHFHALWV
jgi:hypothetical protein